MRHPNSRNLCERTKVNQIHQFHLWKRGDPGQVQRVAHKQFWSQLLMQICTKALMTTYLELTKKALFTAEM